MPTHTNNILLTGYWPPTNDMLRCFSTNPELNPGGWQGKNWNNRGYDIHAYFPVFPEGFITDPVGKGEFKVDYQSTSKDWRRITSELNPCGIITFSRGWDYKSLYLPSPYRWIGKTWDLEKRVRNLKYWIQSTSPTLPDPSPPDPKYLEDGIRESTLPMSEIVRRITESSLNIISYVNKVDFAGEFLSEFIGYHGVWYQATHATHDRFRCFAAGHIHVGAQVTTREASEATVITLNALIDHIEKMKYAH